VALAERLAKTSCSSRAGTQGILSKEQIEQLRGVSRLSSLRPVQQHGAQPATSRVTRAVCG
jgi:hypothetical protein